MIDDKDVRLVMKVGILIVGASSVLLTAAGMLGLAWRIFTLAGGF